MDWMHELYPFFKKKTREGTPPPREKGKTSPVSRTSISEIGTLKAKITHNLGRKKWTGNRLNGLRMHHLHSFVKNVLGETPPPPPPPPLYCEKIKKKPSLALYDLLQLRWKFSRITYIEDRSFEGKNYTTIFGKKINRQGKNGLRMHHLHPFFKNFLGGPRFPGPQPARG